MSRQVRIGMEANARARLGAAICASVLSMSEIDANILELAK
jgi:hypothetical protein